MIVKQIEKNDWKDVKEIYLEAFPKREQKPFISLKRAVKKGRAKIYCAKEDDITLGFIVLYFSLDIIMVDYLAVSQKNRSKGTGSFILNSICNLYSDKRIVLLIEKLDDNSSNQEQRIARRKFYLKNGFTSSNLFMNGKSGDMEILCYGEAVTKEEFLKVFEVALGKLFFKISRTKVY